MFLDQLPVESKQHVVLVTAWGRLVRYHTVGGTSDEGKTPSILTVEQEATDVFEDSTLLPKCLVPSFQKVKIRQEDAVWLI